MKAIGNRILFVVSLAFFSLISVQYMIGCDPKLKYFLYIDENVACYIMKELVITEEDNVKMLTWHVGKSSFGSTGHGLWNVIINPEDFYDNFILVPDKYKGNPDCIAIEPVRNISKKDDSRERYFAILAEATDKEEKNKVIAGLEL
jgi:hypothetical protein